MAGLEDSDELLFEAEVLNLQALVLAVLVAPVLDLYLQIFAGALILPGSQYLDARAHRPSGNCAEQV